ncbi:MAG: hypothetical protein AB7P11_15345 [Hydrogenophaga sp.]|uniref:hypothetical protein n=1 Tax=Hydrogenophaga sp. TaxID=1904254 RepID=UPI003D0C239D
MNHSLIPDCPRCRGSSVATLNRGRQGAVLLGGLAGGISSAATVWAGARTGAAIGAVAGPAGSLLSAVAGAVLAALAGGATGCAAGAVIGDLIDDKVLDNYRCLDCGQRFSRPSTKDPARHVSPSPHSTQTPYPEHAAHVHRSAQKGQVFLPDGSPVIQGGLDDLDDPHGDHPSGFYGPFGLHSYGGYQHYPHIYPHSPHG